MPAAVVVSPATHTIGKSWQMVTHGELPQPRTAPAAHASHLLALPEQSPYTIAAFWFAGQRESAPDVRIAMSLLERQTQTWRDAQWVVDRHAMGQALGHGLRRLGNPVAWIDAQQRIHLFVVATGLGGWAASRVLHLRQAPGSTDLTSLQLDVVRVLPLSWLWNTSHLVRNPPLPLADGGMVLPLHFELGLKYPVFAWFNRDGDLMGLRRVSTRKDLLQPSLLALTPTHWLALMRTQSPVRRVAVVESFDAGAHWQSHADLGLPNPDAALATLALAPQHFAVVQHPISRGRHALAWQLSTDGKYWSAPMTVAQGPEGDEFSYPAMVWADNSLWISYTHQRTHIRWQRWQTESESR
jgi:predicted neuraminidase